MSIKVEKINRNSFFERKLSGNSQLRDTLPSTWSLFLKLSRSSNTRGVWETVTAKRSFRSCSVSQSHPTLRPHGLQHSRPPCPSPTPGAYSNSCPLSAWCHPTISSSVVPFSPCLLYFPASGSFQMSQFFASGGQSIGAPASASVLLMNIQGWFPLGWTGWISLQSKGLSEVSNQSSKASVLLCSAFFIVQLSHPYVTTGKTIVLTRWTLHKLKERGQQDVLGSSFVIRWLGTHLPMQGAHVRSLIWKDFTCWGAARPVSHNYWSPHALELCSTTREAAAVRGGCTATGEQPCSPQLEEGHTQQHTKHDQTWIAAHPTQHNQK